MKGDLSLRQSITYTWIVNSSQKHREIPLWFQICMKSTFGVAFKWYVGSMHITLIRIKLEQ